MGCQTFQYYPEQLRKAHSCQLELAAAHVSISLLSRESSLICGRPPTLSSASRALRQSLNWKALRLWSSLTTIDEHRNFIAPQLF